MTFEIGDRVVVVSAPSWFGQKYYLGRRATIIKIGDPMVMIKFDGANHPCRHWWNENQLSYLNGIDVALEVLQELNGQAR